MEGFRAADTLQEELHWLRALVCVPRVMVHVGGLQITLLQWAVIVSFLSEKYEAFREDETNQLNVMEWNLRFAESVKFWCLKKNKKLDVTGNWTYTNHNCYLETSDFTDKAISWRDAGLAKQRWRSQRWWSEKIKRILTSFFKCKFTAWLLHFTWIGALLALKKVLWCKIFKFANLSPSPSYQIQNDEQTHTTLRRWQQPPK